MSADWLEAGTRYGSAEHRDVTVSRDREGQIKDRDILTIDLPPTALTGIITDANDKALVMAKVQLEGSSEYTYSDGLGNYSLIGLEASGQPRQVKANANGYQSQVAGIVFTKGQVETINMSLAGVVQ